MRQLTLALATVASIAIATPAIAGPTEDFHKLMDDYWAAYLKDNQRTSNFGPSCCPARLRSSSILRLPIM